MLSLADRILEMSIPEPNSGCWLWLGSAWRAPIQLRPFLSVDGASLGAHRVSLEAFKGPIPAGLCACHTCHNTLCVNPDHLYAGTKKQNTQDMMRAGRHFSQSSDEAKAVLAERMRQVNDARRAKPACRRGHSKTSENIYVNPTTGYRTCKQCVRLTREIQTRAAQ